MQLHTRPRSGPRWPAPSPDAESRLEPCKGAGNTDTSMYTHTNDSQNVGVTSGSSAGASAAAAAVAHLHGMHAAMCYVRLRAVPGRSCACADRLPLGGFSRGPGKCMQSAPRAGQNIQPSLTDRAPLPHRLQGANAHKGPLQWPLRPQCLLACIRSRVRSVVCWPTGASGARTSGCG